MSLKAFRKVKIADLSVSQFQDSVAAFLSQLVLNVILSGRLIENIDILSASVNSINHGLGRAPRGYFIVKSTADTRVWSVAANQSTPLVTLELSASANATISLYVF